MKRWYISTLKNKAMCLIDVNTDKAYKFYHRIMKELESRLSAKEFDDFYSKL